MFPNPLCSSVYMVYSDADSDNPNYHGYIATSAADGMIIGRSTAYFATSLIHEIGHAVDSTLASPDAVHPGYGTSFSSTSAWHAAADADGYATSAYGAGSFGEDFPETGRAVLLDAIYPGGLAAWSNNNPNLTQITHQLAAFKAVAGSFYTVGGTCDPALKFPFPTLFVDVAVPTTTTTSASGPTAGPYGQCESPSSLASLCLFRRCRCKRRLGDEGANDVAQTRRRLVDLHGADGLWRWVLVFNCQVSPIFEMRSILRMGRLTRAIF